MKQWNNYQLRRTNVIPSTDRLAALEAWVTTLDEQRQAIEARLEALEGARGGEAG